MGEKVSDFMARKPYTNEEYREIIKEKYGDAYTLLSDYVGANQKIHVRHNVCGTEWYPNAGDLMKQSICPVCGKKKYSNALATKPEEFRNRFYQISNGEYELLSEYHRSDEKIKIKHLKCDHEFMMSPSKYLSGQRCPQCRPNRKKTQKEFEQEVFDMYGEEFSVVGKFVNTYTKIDILHNLCGNINSVKPSDFLMKKTFCKYCNQSGLETIVSNTLKELNIGYDIGKTYDDLLGVSGKQLSYDFHLFYNQHEYLIEAQGEQHYEPIKYFGDENKFKIQQEHDKRKRDYALSHNLELIEIPYWDYKNVKEILQDRLNI